MILQGEGRGLLFQEDLMSRLIALLRLCSGSNIRILESGGA